MANSKQPAAKVKWRTAIIPQDAENLTEPVKALPAEIEGIINNPGELRPPEPLDLSQVYNKTELSPSPRYNANVPYSPQPIVYSANDFLLMKAIREAVKNGWTDYHRYANDATTIGMEAEAVINGMRKLNTKVQDLLLDKQFAKAFLGESWEADLPKLVIADDIMQALKGILIEKGLN